MSRLEWHMRKTAGQDRLSSCCLTCRRRGNYPQCHVTWINRCLISDLTATSSVYASVMTWVPHRTAVKTTELTRNRTQGGRDCVEWSGVQQLASWQLSSSRHSVVYTFCWLLIHTFIFVSGASPISTQNTVKTMYTDTDTLHTNSQTKKLYLLIKLPEIKKKMKTLWQKVVLCHNVDHPYNWMLVFWEVFQFLYVCFLCRVSKISLGHWRCNRWRCRQDSWAGV